MMASSQLPFIMTSKRPRRVVLAPVGIDAIDPTFDAVPAHTAVVVIALQQAFAGIDNEEPRPSS